MNITVTKYADYRVLQFEERSNYFHPGPLLEVIKAVGEKERNIVLDLGKIDYVNLTEMKTILDTIKYSEQNRTNISICNLKRQVRRALKVNGLPGTVPLYSSLLQAANCVERETFKPASRAEFTDLILIAQKSHDFKDDLERVMLNHPLKPKFRIMQINRLDNLCKTMEGKRFDCIILDVDFKLFALVKAVEYCVCSASKFPAPVFIATKDSKLNKADILVRHGATDVLRYPFEPVEAVTRLQTHICLNKYDEEFNAVITFN